MMFLLSGRRERARQKDASSAGQAGEKGMEDTFMNQQTVQTTQTTQMIQTPPSSQSTKRPRLAKMSHMPEMSRMLEMPQMPEMSQVSQRTQTIRLAGLCFLAMVVFGLISEILVRQRIFLPGNPAGSAVNLLSNVFLFRIGIVCDLLMATSYLLTALMLYKLLASVDRHLAGAMVVFAAAGSVLLMADTMFQLAPLVVLQGAGMSDALLPAQRQEVAAMFYRLYQEGYMIGQVFFSLWVFPLGLLIRRSSFIPRVFGVLFLIETCTGLVAVLVHFLAPNETAETLVMLPMMVAEFGFLFFLLFHKVRAVSEQAD